MNSFSTTVNSIAIGGFDGMHRAHQKLFDELGEQGAVVVIETGYANLTPGKERAKYTHYPIFYYTLESIRHLDDVGFVQMLGEAFPALQKIVIGYDFRFGKARAYGIEALRAAFAGEVVVVDEVMIEGISVHSHKIRDFLKTGDIGKANRLLGRDYLLSGYPVAGQGLGKTRFVPTINIEGVENLLPKEGVYTAFFRADSCEHFAEAVAFIGHRTTTDGSFAVEVHVLEGEAAAEQRVEIVLRHYIRENRRFEAFDALAKQINEDIITAKHLLGRLAL